jgi:hypothetical protein
MSERTVEQMERELAEARAELARLAALQAQQPRRPNRWRVVLLAPVALPLALVGLAVALTGGVVGLVKLVLDEIAEGFKRLSMRVLGVDPSEAPQTQPEAADQSGWPEVPATPTMR